VVSVFLAAVLGGALVASSGQDPSAVQDLSAKSQIVFRGTVRVLNSATVDADTVDGLAVVRLNELVTGPALLKGFVGRDITVRLRAPNEVKAGEERLFFANPWVFGDSVGVVEVGSFPQTQARAQTLAQDVARGQSAAVDAELRAKLDAASSVVAGRVATVRPSAPQRLSEHDPQWTEADIEVSETLKGTAKGRVTIVFPASTDVMWFKTPKPKQGQDGVFILGPGDKVGAGSRLAVSEPQHILPLSELSRVKALLK
jgi:hypothetical protein